MLYFLNKDVTVYMANFTREIKNKIAKNGKFQLYKSAIKRKLCYKYSSVVLSDKEMEYQKNYVFSEKHKFSIIVPLYNTPENFLSEMINSVIEQTYPEWELCLADGSDATHKYIEKYCTKISEQDGRIRYKKLTENKGISENTNACIKMASGDYIVLFDHDDLLHPAALFENMKAITEQNADFIYCDEDKFTDIKGKHFDAHYKPDFAPDTLCSVNYICHLTVFKKSLLDEVGLFRKEFDGSQDHDMILRLTEKAKTIVHIPKILYHWRVSGVSVASDPYAKPYTIEAGKKAVKEHLSRMGLEADVESTEIHPNFYRVKYKLCEEPLVSILIPNCDHIEDLSRCINSIIEKSTYNNYEIIIIENNSKKETFDYYDSIKSNEKIKVIEYKTNEFNFSAINNFGVKYAAGKHLLFLNNDTQIISPAFIEEMLMFSQRNDVGAVGAMLYYPNNTIQHAGVIVGIGGSAGHAFKYFPNNVSGYFGRACYQQNLSAVTAACLMVKKSVFEDVGGFDESLKVAFNDVDFCLKLRDKNYLNCFTPFAQLYHFESQSRGLENSPQKAERFEAEKKKLQNKWQTYFEEGDPYYNVNLTLSSEDFTYRK